MENLLVILIVALAAGYIVRRFWKSAKEDVECGCGCSSCNNGTVCKDEKRLKAILFNDGAANEEK